jgi:hypothetical protein
MTKTKFRPILFSTPMVQAILENRKTMTRRTKGLEKFNQSPDEWRYDGVSIEGDYAMELLDIGKPKEIYREIFPAYNLGDILWVRETFRPIEQEFGNPRYEYKATENINLLDKWKPSLFMPKQACRIFLKIKSIKVERLQDISEEDIKNEGVKVLVNNIGNVLFELGEKHGPIFFTSNINTMSIHEVWLVHWAALWCKINGIQSWIANPFVFVYEFERIEKPLDFIPNGQEAKIPKSF